MVSAVRGHAGSRQLHLLHVPETSCIASNKLLSRSVLRSVGGRPHFDTRLGSVSGFLDTLGTK